MKKFTRMRRGVTAATIAAKGVSSGGHHWGWADGKDVFLYQLRNSQGMRVAVCNYGAVVQSVVVANSRGEMDDVVLGYNTLQGYVDDPFYIGGVVGRYANRIAGGKVTIDDVPYQLTQTPEGYHQHGGKKGFNKVVWAAQAIETPEGTGIQMQYASPHGEEGFPGNLTVIVTYILDDENGLAVSYHATTDQATVLNLTQHSYFNLAGAAHGSINHHKLQLHATCYLPVTGQVLPTGEYASVYNTPFDFTQLRPIGQTTEPDDEQLRLTSGYDHTWVLKKDNTGELVPAATLYEPKSGRRLEVFTTEPGIHFYGGNFLNDTIRGKNDRAFRRCGALCLETQHFGDAPNKPHFPTTVLRPGEVFSSKTIFRFTA